MIPVFNSMVNVFNQIGFQCRKHAPEIMIVGGIVGGVTATVLACVATAKTGEIVGEAKEELNAIHKTVEEKPEYTEKEKQRDITRVYVKTGVELAKNYAVPAAIGVASIASILGGTNILNKRNAGLAIALSSSALEVKKLRDGIVKEFGEEKGREIYKKLVYGVEEEEVKEKVTGDDGKTKTVKKLVKKVDEDNVKNISYVRIFDQSNPFYEEDSTYNWFFLKAQQNYFNDKLRADGYLFMNEADKALGFPKSKAGQIVGWNYDPSNPNIDNFVDLNITEVEKVDEYGIKRTIYVIEYNVDGSILNKVDWNL